MNKDGRKEIDRAIELIREGEQIVRDIADDEQCKFENLSEGLQASDSGARLEAFGMELEEAAEEVSAAAEAVSQAMEQG